MLCVTWKSVKGCVKNFSSSQTDADACWAAFLASNWPHFGPQENSLAGSGPPDFPVHITLRRSGILLDTISPPPQAKASKSFPTAGGKDVVDIVTV